MFAEKEKIRQLRELLTAEITASSLGSIDLSGSESQTSDALTDEDLVFFCDTIKKINKKSFSIEKLDLSNNSKIQRFSTVVTLVDTLAAIGLQSISKLVVRHSKVNLLSITSTFQGMSNLKIFCEQVHELDLMGNEINYEIAKSFCGYLLAYYGEGKLKTIKLSITDWKSYQFKKEPLSSTKFEVFYHDNQLKTTINSFLTAEQNPFVQISVPESPLTINGETTSLLENGGHDNYDTMESSTREMDKTIVNKKREHWLRYEFSPPRLSMPPPLRVADLSSRSMIWLASRLTPDAYEHVVVNQISNFINGSATTLNVLWPLALFGLTLRDIIYYGTVPQNRYENSLGAILAGVAPNESTWTTHFGSYLPGQWLFSMAPVTLVAVPMVTGITQMIRQRNRHQDTDVNKPDEHSIAAIARKEFAVIHNDSANINRKVIIKQLTTIATGDHSLLTQLSAQQSLASIVDACKRDALNFLSKKEKNDIFTLALTGLYEAAQLRHNKKTSPLEWIRTIYADHLLWSLGEKAESTRSKIYHAAQQAFLFWPITLYQWYASVRWLEIIVKKTIEGFQYYQHQQACESGNGTWDYLEWIGNYACSVCGDWSFANYQDMYSAQGCLNNLLAEQRDPETILNAMNRFQQHPDINTLDASQQQLWTQWTPAQLQSLFDELLQIENLVLDTLDVSQPNPNYPSVNQQSVSKLNRLMQQIRVNNLIMQNVPGGPEMISTLGPSLNHTTSADFTGGTLGDQGWNELTQQAAFKQLSNVVVSNNQIDSEGMIQTSNPLINSNVTHLNLSSNQINTQQGLDATARSIQNLRELNLANNNLSELDLRSLGEAIQQSSTLDTLDLTNCHLTDQQIIRLAPYLQNSSIKNLILSGNQLTGESIATVLRNLNTHHRVSINVSDNRIHDRDMQTIAEVASGLSLNIFNLADNHFTVQGLQLFLDKVPQIQINGINVADNDLGDDVGLAFYHLLTQFTTTLNSINVANNEIAETGGIYLAQGITQSNATITKVELQNNPECGSAVASAFAETVTQKHGLSYLDLSYCGIDPNGAKEIAAIIQQCGLKTLLLNGNLFDDSVGVSYAEHLITPTPNLYNANQDSTRNDEARRIRNSAPATQLEQFELGDGLGAESLRALYLVWPSTRNSFATLCVNGSPISPDKLSQQASRKKENSESSFQQNTTAFRFFQIRESLPNTQSPSLGNGAVNSTSTTSSLYLAANLNLLPSIQLLLLMYVIYRMIKPLLRSVFSGSANFFQSNTTNQASQFVFKSKEENKKDTSSDTFVKEGKLEI